MSGVVVPTSGNLAWSPSAILPVGSIHSDRIKSSREWGDAVPTVFQLVSDHALPAFDTSKSLKTILLSNRGVRRFNYIRSRWRGVISVMLHIGNILMLVTVLAPRSIGHATAVLAPILQLPGTVIIISAVRVQMLRILLGTYDFWFFTVSNIIFCACFWILLGDIRIVSMAFGCIILQISICADAQVGNARQLLAASIINAAAQTLLFFAVMLQLVDVSSHQESQVTLVEFASKGSALTTRDMLVNMQFNIVVLFTKLVYRNWRIARDKTRAGRKISANSILVPQSRKCASYQCVVRLVPVPLGSSTSVDPTPSIGSLSSGSSPVLGSTVAQLEFESISEVFKAGDTIVPMRRGGYLQRLLLTSDKSLTLHRSALRAFLVICGSVGFACTVLADPLSFLPFRLPAGPLRMVAAVCSSTFCFTFIALYQRQLLNRLVWSFDFFFLSSNITVINCCLSSLLDWDNRISVVWSFWLWMHWAITLDALTPAVAAALGFRRIHTMPVVIVMFLVQVLTTLDFFFIHKLNIPDWTLFSTTIGSRELFVKLAPFFFARIWSVLLWSGRLLWRTLTRRCEEERLMLHGQVEFHFNWLQQVEHARKPSLKLISQISASSSKRLRRLTSKSSSVQG